MDKGKLCLGAGLGGVMFAIALVAFLSPPPEKEQLFDRSEARVDPLARDLARCRDMPAPDATCTQIWNALRSHFLGQGGSGR